MALKGGEVVEELRQLALLLLLELRDLALLALDLAHDLRRLVLGDALAAEVAAGVAARLVRRELGLHEPVRLGLEVADRLLALDEQSERGRLHPAQGHGAVERRPEPDRRGAGGVHPHQPVGLRARAGRGLELGQLLPGAQAGEGLLDRLARHRVEPQPLNGLLHLRGLVDVGEDQLALAPGVAGVHHHVHVLARHQPVDRVQLLLRALVVGDELELLGDDRQVREAPLLQLRVICLGLGEPHQVPDRPGDQVAVALQVGLVLRLFEAAWQRRRDVAPDGRFLGYNECGAHERRINIEGPGTGVYRRGVVQVVGCRAMGFAAPETRDPRPLYCGPRYLT